MNISFPSGGRARSTYDPNADSERVRLGFQADLFREADIALIRRGISELEPFTGLRVLDVGAADGVYSESIWRTLGYPVVHVGIDKDPRAVERARERLEGGEADLSFAYECVDVENEGQMEEFVTAHSRAGERFDVITCFAALQHLEDPVRVLRLLRGVLRDGGFIVARAPDDGLMVAGPDLEGRLVEVLEISCRTPGASNRHFGRHLEGAIYRSGYRGLQCSVASFTTVGRDRMERNAMFETFFRHRQLTMDRAVEAASGDLALAGERDALLVALDALRLGFEGGDFFFAYCEIGVLGFNWARDSH